MAPKVGTAHCFSVTRQAIRVAQNLATPKAGRSARCACSIQAPQQEGRGSTAFNSLDGLEANAEGMRCVARGWDDGWRVVADTVYWMVDANAEAGDDANAQGRDGCRYVCRGRGRAHEKERSGEEGEGGGEGASRGEGKCSKKSTDERIAHLFARKLKGEASVGGRGRRFVPRESCCC